jgi:hypothetical protein
LVKSSLYKYKWLLKRPFVHLEVSGEGEPIALEPTIPLAPDGLALVALKGAVATHRPRNPLESHRGERQERHRRRQAAHAIKSNPTNAMHLVRSNLDKTLDKKPG